MYLGILRNMIIAGLQKTTLIDYPGRIACTVFLAICNFRCPWCYSSELVLPLKITRQPRISETEFVDFLRKRKGMLEGVVVCGGEPTVNKDLPIFLEKIKQLNFAIKLDTNGSHPEMLRELVQRGLVDYIAMDIKTSLKARNKNGGLLYQSLLIEGTSLEKIKESVLFLKEGKVDFEFRTTVVPTVHQKEDFIEIAQWIGGKNVKYYLQDFLPQKTVDPAFEKIKPFPREFLEEIVKEISSYFKICAIR